MMHGADVSTTQEQAACGSIEEMRRGTSPETSPLACRKAHAAPVRQFSAQILENFRSHALIAVVFVAVGATGCMVPRGKYDRALADLQIARAQTTTEAERADAEAARAEKLTAEIAQLGRDLQDRDAKLRDGAVSASELSRKLEDLAVFNDELSKRLKSAGQNVDKLASERGTLTEELAETRVKLDELKRQQAAGEARVAQYQGLLRSFQKLVDAGQLSVSVRRGRMVLELPNDVLFDSGRADVKSAGKKALASIASVLKGLTERTFQVAGHTDNVKIQSSKYPSNWELSTARGVEVTKLLIAGGMDPRRLSAAGYGEWDPTADNATAEGRAKNRRIEITLVPDMEEMVKLPGVIDSAAPPAPPTAKPPPASSSLR